jgi:hypothetical protein
MKFVIIDVFKSSDVSDMKTSTNLQGTTRALRPVIARNLTS